MHEKGVLKSLVNGLHLPEAVMRLIEADNEAEQAEMRDVTPEHKGTGAEDLAAELAKPAEAEPTREAVAGNPKEEDLF